MDGCRAGLRIFQFRFPWPKIAVFLQVVLFAKDDAFYCDIVGMENRDCPMLEGKG